MRQTAKKYTQASPSDDIAIVGMACIFPGAPDLKTYWQNIVKGVDAVTDPPDDWGGEPWFDPDSTANDRIHCKQGGFLGDLSRFDPLPYGIMPTTVDGAEPEHFLALRVVNEALADAGIPDIPLNRERTELIIGRGTFVNRGYTTLHQHGLFIDQTLRLLKELHPKYTEEELQGIKERLKAKLPPFNAETSPGLVSTIMTGRIANRLDFKGTNYSVDAACASSLIAVENGMQDLLCGKCDAVLAGGIQLSTHHLILMVFCQLGALSQQCRIRPFDKHADGTLLGEGIGIVVLKRRRDAERDGNRIYALIKAVGSASDGRGKSVVAPRVEGEESAVRKAYELAGVSPSTIELVEAHGTAMPLGDVTEIQALTRVFGTDCPGPAWCAIGSVKSMIAHLIPAAGIAGLIKTVLALYHKTLPPTLHCEEPNPELEMEKTPFYINTETRPWIHGIPDTPRRAGVNAFGFGGINAHAVLEEYTNAQESESDDYCCNWDTELCVFQAGSRQELIEQGEKVLGYIVRSGMDVLLDLAYTLNSDLGDRPCCLAIVASSMDDLAKKLRHAIKCLQDPKRIRIKEKVGIYFFEEPLGPQGKLAFLFPGEGSQYINMLSDLCIHFPEVRSCFDILDQAFTDHPRDFLPSRVIFPPPSWDEAGRVAAEERLWHMDCSVDAVITADRALFRLLGLLQIYPQVILGHSSGEFMALEAAGTLDIANDEELIQHISVGNNVIEGLASADDIPQAPLVAAGAVDRKILSEVIDNSHGKLFVAMDNCPNQVVLCGDRATMDRALDQIRKTGAICQTLAFSRPYHTPMFKPACAALEEFFKGLKIVSPKIEIYSCMTTRPMPSDPDEIRRLAVGQWACPVRFRETIESMYSAGVRLFLEVGPRSNITGFVKDILRKKPHLALASNVNHRSGITQLHHALGLLAAHGVHMQLDHLYRRRRPRKLDLESVEGSPVAKKRAPKLSLSLPVLSLGEEESKGLQKIRTLKVLESNSESPGQDIPPERVVNTRTQVISEYLETMERFLYSQQEVMNSYLARRRVAPELQGDVKHQVHCSAPLPKADRTSTMPLIGTVVSHVPGERLCAIREFSLDEDLFLLDHTLGREISVTDKELTGLPMMPLTMSMEILAEAAALLVPEKLFIGMKDIRAYKWITFENRQLILKVEAKRQSAGEVRAQLREANDPDPEKSVGLPILEGTMVFGEQYPESPVLDDFPLQGRRPSRWTPDALYSEGMFSGSSFQGMASVDWWGKDGAEAVLKTLSLDSLFRSQPSPCFVMDPVLLDAAGQLVAYWIADHRETGFNVYPFRVEALQVYSPNLPPSVQVKCRARIRPLAENQLRSDIDVIGPDGRLHMRLIGWDDRSFDLPSAFYRVRFRPREVLLSESWSAPIAAFPEAETMECCYMEDYPENLLHGHGLVWQRVLTHLVLSRRERKIWQRPMGSERRRTEWLLARVAGKDAMRLFLKKHYGMDLCLPDIDIESDKYGRPVVRGSWTGEINRIPSLSLSHTKGIGAAMVSESGECGIDVERLDLRRKGIEQIVLRPEERKLVESILTSFDIEWCLRIWCAKEAVGKALGRGLPGGPLDLTVRDLNPETGTVDLVVSGALVREFPELEGKELQAHTLRKGDLIVSTALYMSIVEKGQNGE
jgi:acyl transferase domain-containing protein/phosphopantetheinyl transferase